MMSKNNTNGRNQFAMLTIDDLVPQDHLVRKIDAALDFEFIYPIVEATYSVLGRPSIDPVILIKLVFIQCLFSIYSVSVPCDKPLRKSIPMSLTAGF